MMVLRVEINGFLLNVLKQKESPSSARGGKGVQLKDLTSFIHKKKIL